MPHFTYTVRGYWCICKILRKHAHDKSQHYCSRYVSDALEAGGFKPDRPGSAYQYWSEKRLEKIGYVEIDKPTSLKEEI